MKAYKAYYSIFNYDVFYDVFFKYIRHKRNTGLDKMTVDVFEKNLDTNIKKILEQIDCQEYKFKFYKARLISKGREKLPRVISIPTVTDRLVLKALHLMLSLIYETDIKSELVHIIINRLKMKKDKYRYYIKLDIENFYPTIDHYKLFKIIRKRIRKPEIIRLIKDAITNKSLVNFKEHVSSSEIGIPQGLSISNILSSIYLSEFDKLFIRKRVFSFFRYVDDILILHNNSNQEEIKNIITNKLSDLGLRINIDKYSEGEISDEFIFLGYKNTADGFSVRPSSVESLHQSILKNFIAFKNSDDMPITYLEWIVNIRITGCIFNNKKYGWMFFYSQIDDLTLLFKLDSFVKKMIKIHLKSHDRFVPKKFVRTYHEIIGNLSSTKYVPNFSDYSINKKAQILEDVFKIENPMRWHESKIENLFNKKIFQSIKDLERDIQRMS